MGLLHSKMAVISGKDPILVTVSTGDVKLAGTDNDVMMKFFDEEGCESKAFKMDKFFHNDFQAGRTDKFLISDLATKLGEVAALEVWREGFFDDELFLNVVFVRRMKTNTEHVFPIHRWIPMKKPLKIRRYDSFLPQHDLDWETRRKELEWKRQMYEISMKTRGLPVMCSNLPIEQSFSEDYQWDLSARKKTLFFVSKLQVVKTPKWKTLQDMNNLYTSRMLPLPKPAVDQWFMSDECFAEQRISGCNPLMIKLCTEIPAKFAVTPEMVKPFLEGKSLSEALDNKRLFLTDHAVMQGIEQSKKEFKLVAPFGLFYLMDDGRLLPVAIQLHQDPGEQNPVFLPSDPSCTWTLVKMWYNMADASVHQSKAHLGFTHLIGESICLVTNRQLSPSHPIFRLLAPHFRFLLAINHRGLALLMAPGGWIDQTMAVGRLGVFDIIRRSNKTWRINEEGTLPTDIQQRGVTPDVLPHYPYRDDALPIFYIIKDYASAVIEGHYASKETLTEDTELQAWAAEMSKPFDDGGAGLQGVPGEGTITDTEQLVEFVTSIIFMSSVQHAAVNFNQYDMYAYPANYPAQIRGEPPSSKVALTEQDIVEALPRRVVTANIMLVTSLLSERATNALGNFEIQYAYDKIAKNAQERFREELKKARERFLERNSKRKYSYTVLDPAEIPNAISI